MSGILGIDLGLKGGLAIRSELGLIIEVMPVVGDEIDGPALARWIKGNRDQFEIAYLEIIHWMRGKGGSSMLSFGIGAGTVRGILTALEVPYRLVKPAQWQKAMFAGVPELTKTVNAKGEQKETKDTKTMSCVAAARLFPAYDFRASEKSKKPHEGMVEAALIAEYGWRSLRGIGGER